MSGLPTPLRLRAAAALCLLPLGLVWSTSADFYLPGVYLPSTYVPGTYVPGGHELGAQTPARIFLVVAATVFLIAAARPRTQPMKRAVQAAAGSAGVALALALGARALPPVLCLLGALALVVPLVRPRNTGVFVPTALRR